MRQVFSEIKLAVVFILSFIIYGYALFPGRIYRDSVNLIELMLNGKSIDTWSASYFRLLQVLSNNGSNISLASFSMAAIFYASLYVLINNLGLNKRVQLYSSIFLVFSPFVGVFAFTVGHDNFTTSASFLYLTLLCKKQKQFTKIDYAIVFFASFLASTSGLGVILTFGFCLAMLIKKFSIASILSVATAFTFFFAGSTLFNVERSNLELSLMNMLGDIKCIAQHKNANISKAQWNQLGKIGNEQDWLEPKTCVIADYSFFALENASKEKNSTIKLWINLVAQNPQIALQARIQRTSVALPPLFFRNPPNMFDTSYKNPVGLNAMNDLQIFPDLFKTSVDLQSTSQKKLFGQIIFERLVLFPTFLFNQRSDIWGWGGLWLSILAFSFLYRKRGDVTSRALVLLPNLFLHLGVVCFAPSPSPRYVFSSILLGIFFTLVFIFEKIYKNSEASI